MSMYIDESQILCRFMYTIAIILSIGISQLFCCCCLPTPLILASGGGVDLSARGTSASFSVHLTSGSVTPSGSVHNYRVDNVVRM